MKAHMAFLLTASALGSCATDNHLPKLPTVDLGYQVHRAISFNETYKTYNFTNIPYAEPPLGPLRFKAPIPPRGRKYGIQDGSIGKICPQTNARWIDIGYQFVSAYAAGNFPFNYSKADENVAHMPPPPVDARTTEDCLVLDVVVPKAVLEGKHKSKGAPVLVWIFGGGYVIGDKAMFGTPHDVIAATQKDGSDGAIWVAMNYRLGAFGFLSGPTLQASGGTANAGLHDQRLALEWVQDNIRKFGGDPDNVTIMGISAGAGSVMHQITAYGGLKPVPFRRAIPQSPGFIPVPGTQQQEETFQTFLSLLNVSSLDEARCLPFEKVFAASAKQIYNAPYGTWVYGPVVDNDFVPGVPSKLFLQGSFAKNISILGSYGSEEGILFTDPRGVDNEKILQQQIRNIIQQLSSKNVDFIFKSLYPPIYDGSHPYKTSLERAQLIIVEAAILCNQNVMLKVASQQGIGAFGYQFAVPPGIHGYDQPYIFSNGPTDGVDPTISTIMKHSIAGFVTRGAPDITLNGGILFPPYGRDKSYLNLVVNDTKVIRDPSANARCDWWQKALFY